MTYPAAIAVAEQMSKPLVTHIHSTEFDRSGEHVNQMVYEIERQGMHAADKVIAVSNYTKNIVVNRYGLAGEKVEVVYNGVQAQAGEQETHAQTQQDKAEKIGDCSIFTEFLSIPLFASGPFCCDATPLLSNLA